MTTDETMNRNEMIDALNLVQAKKGMMDEYIAENGEVPSIVMKAMQYERQVQLLSNALGIKNTENIAENIVKAAIDNT